jgi:hypothetical protein
MGGIRYVSGHPDRPPVRIGISIGDSIAALHGAIGALMALRHRDTTGGRWNGQQGDASQSGQGQMVDVALYEAVFNLMESMVPEYDHAGVVRERTGGALPGIVPSNTYTTGDGENIVIAGNGDAIFKRLMRAIDRADLADDPVLANNAGRVTRAEEIDAVIQAWCETQNINDALTKLKQADVPVSKIYSVRDMVTDPQFIARQMLEQHQFKDGSPITMPAITPKFSETPGCTRWLGWMWQRAQAYIPCTCPGRQSTHPTAPHPRPRPPEDEAREAQVGGDGGQHQVGRQGGREERETKDHAWPLCTHPSLSPSECNFWSPRREELGTFCGMESSSERERERV